MHHFEKFADSLISKIVRAGGRGIRSLGEEITGPMIPITPPMAPFSEAAMTTKGGPRFGQGNMWEKLDKATTPGAAISYEPAFERDSRYLKPGTAAKPKTEYLAGFKPTRIVGRAPVRVASR